MTLALLVFAGLLAGSAAAQGDFGEAGAPPPRRPSPPPAARDDDAPEPPSEPGPELRQALRDYYVRALEDELQLSPAQSAAVRPKVEALLDAQRNAMRLRGDVGLRLLRSSRADLAATGADSDEAAAALEAAMRAETDELASITAARKSICAQLQPRQAARFLAFESRFQDRIRRMVEQRRAGGPEGGPGSGRGPEGGGGGPEGGPPHPPGEPPHPPGEAPHPPGEGGGLGEPGGLGDEARRTALIVFTHELRMRLELTDEQALLLLPKVEALFETRVKGERQRRLIHERLLDAAEDSERSDADVKALVAEALKLDDDMPKKIDAARRAITSTLTPVQAARFLLLEHRAERVLRDQARRAREGWNAMPQDDEAQPQQQPQRPPMRGPGGGFGGQQRPRLRPGLRPFRGGGGGL